MVQLEVLNGPQQGTVFDLEDGTCNIGRMMGNEVIIYDEKVSSRHASIVRSAGKLILRDLQSRNGTFLNGLPVDSAVIRNSDIVRMGDTELVFHCSEQQPSTDTAVVQLVGESESSPVIRETVQKTEGSTVFDVDLTGTSLEALLAAHRNLKALYRINSVFNSTFDLSVLFERIMDQIFDVTRATRGVLMLIDGNGALLPKVIRNREEADGGKLVLSHTIVNKVLQRGSGILTSDAMADDRFSAEKSIMEFQIRSAMCVPIRYKDQITGIIYVDNKAPSGSFKRSDLELLAALAVEAGGAIENGKLYEANVRAERLAALGEALANLSHYIKNVLMCMQGGGQLVQKALDERNFVSLEKGWNIVRRNERKLSGLVMDMLSYCKERQPLYEQCDLAEVVREVIELSEPLLQEKQIKVEHNIGKGKATVEADSEGLTRALLNIITNAIDAIEPGKGAISISVSEDRPARQVLITVKDNGCGIPPDVLPKIFEAFCSTKGSKGTGLGLAVVQKTVKEHGGTIDVRTKVGEGAAFIIKLPATAERKGAARGKSARPPGR
ncbi:MAG TPA: ATP-binding protein [Planctomycetota bacterium]|nr:ATP-binding protein [Planctomycetota bacterium]